MVWLKIFVAAVFSVILLNCCHFLFSSLSRSASSFVSIPFTRAFSSFDESRSSLSPARGFPRHNHLLVSSSITGEFREKMVNCRPSLFALVTLSVEISRLLKWFGLILFLTRMQSSSEGWSRFSTINPDVSWTNSVDLWWFWVSVSVTKL